MRVLDLFSGIGGFSLGLESTGHFKTVGFCEIDPFCRAVLRKHWPTVPIHDDIRTLPCAEYEGVDWITGGFPCQDVSAAGKGAGLAGERSGLFAELHRVIAAVRPGGLLIENVPALRTRGADTVFSSLEAIGYTVWPFVVGAWAVGAPHRRERVWIVAYRSGERRGSERHAGRCAAQECGQTDYAAEGPADDSWRRGVSPQLGNAERNRLRISRRATTEEPLQRCDWPIPDPRVIAACNTPAETARRINACRKSGEPAITAEQIVMFMGEFGIGTFFEAGVFAKGMLQSLADANRNPIRKQRRRAGRDRTAQAVVTGPVLADSRSLPGDGRTPQQGREASERIATRWPSNPGEPQHEWERPRLVESGVGSSVDGLSRRLAGFARRNALKACGNSVVPQVVAAIGRAIVEATQPPASPAE